MARHDRELPKVARALPEVEAGDGLRRTVSSVLALVALSLTCAACRGSPTVLTAFRTEQQAQEHCPGDIVVWVDPLSGLFEQKGHGSYALSNAGRYACRGVAERAGMYAATN